MTAIEDQARSIFLAALERAPDEWSAFLDGACGGKTALRARVNQLLHAHQASGSIHGGTVAASVTADDPISERPGTVVGPYKLLEQIGEGGFGVVFMAEQQQPIRRKVALKVLKPGMDTRQVVARFEAERQALGLMDHPNIAHVFDGGTTGEPGRVSAGSTRGADATPLAGRPYFVMELVRGVPVTDFCDQNKLSIRERLKLFIDICHAVQHAHQKGIIHRDIKPSNVLVTLLDGRAVVKVIDFGIAKAVGQQLTDKTLFTHFAQMIGTPLYMSPEQAQMTSQDVDTRSDVYSLGVLLYELLTGTTPFDKERLGTVGYDEIRRIIREEEPPKPSTRISTLGQAASTVSTNRQSEPKRLGQLFRGELDWIVMQALDKDRNRRYESASAFAADVQRYLNDEPVQACPPSAGNRLRKFVRRHRGPVLAASAILLLLVAGIVGTATGLVRAITERNQKEDARRQAVEAAETAAEAERHTRQALNIMTDEVVEDLLSQQAELTDERREFLKKVLAQHESLAAARADDPWGRQSKAAGYSRVGRLREILGDLKEAESADREALALFKQLADDFPAEPQFRRDLSASQHNLANLLRSMTRFEEAESAYRETLSSQKQLARDFPDSPDFRRLLANSHFNLAILLSDTSRPAKAESHYQEALAIREQLVRELPKRPDLRHELASTYLNLAIVFTDTNRMKDAEDASRQAIALQEKLVRDFPNRSSFRADLATSRQNLGVLLVRTLRMKEAEAVYLDALAIWKRVVADFPARPEFRQGLARSHNNLANLLGALNRMEEAESMHRASLAIRKQLAAEYPNRPEYTRELAQSLGNLAEVLRKTGRTDEAEARHRDALASFKQLVTRFPNVPDFRNELAGQLGNVAGIHKQRGEFAAAVQLLEEARPHHQAALEANPKNPVYRKFYRNVLVNLAQNYFGLSDHAGVATSANELARSGYDPVNDAYLAACFLCWGARLAEKDSKLVEDKREELARGYTGQAMALLRQAVALGFKDPANMKANPDLEPLQARDDFQKLLAELEGKVKE